MGVNFAGKSELARRSDADLQLVQSDDGSREPTWYNFQPADI